ncbi:Holliday junction endonuclease RuvC [Alkalithermobacter thermoalcaliphilus JW-YL-7 = DSM 7308]|uniref:Crossover junction endodeoxyribonuclease RuvC n=1 Tax=Alkalithermobacter thermoalcaliphilus JW-YL-7 = DSM 7308 TaxID=1121328 RepID=A0A150FPE1_CLOPD|nr:Crossover junction endodeoxyribonuclease ruvC [[Clostridium] paradoxum JW-YL-7 = DSM 7308]SHK52447.1 Holliday junction endonuclease RuvC [[Clostridium] paradoxum JW-YL-7 = DSM 7308]
MIVLGIDPGIATLGYGILEYSQSKFKVLDYGAIITKANTSFSDRLDQIYKGVNILINKYNVDVVAIEELFFNKNVKTAITVAHARGVCILAASHNKKSVYEYTPLQVKQGVVGYGRADKIQVQSMIKSILNLKQVPKPDDVADALAVAVCHCHSLKFESLFKV